ncbi:MAG: hypothetical protein ACE5HD_04300 [Acidobacteriota bacterium]
MKRFVSLAGAGLLVLGLGINVTPAVNMSEILTGEILGNTPTLPDPFLCDNDIATPCNVFQRYYGDLDSNDVNAQANSLGFPQYRKKKARYSSVGGLLGNWGAVADLSRACEAWYSLWTAVLDPGTGTFLTYYAGQSTIVNNSEIGSIILSDCGTSSMDPSGACFGRVDGVAQTLTDQPDNPRGNGAHIGGFEVVPIPTPALNAASGNIDISWPGPAAVTNVNRPSSVGAVCPAGSTFNDLTATSAPSPIFGVALYVHRVADATALRSIASLEGSSVDAGNLLTLFQNNQTGVGLGCTNNGPSGDCPGVHQIACSAGIGGQCAGNSILFAPVAQTISVSQGFVDAALGADGPVGSGVAVFNTKVAFRGSVTGSTASEELGGKALLPGGPNPSLMTLFSANSAPVGFSALAARVDLGNPVLHGNKVTLSWGTVGAFLEFRLQRSEDGITFTDLATVPATEAASYAFTDTLHLRGKRPSSLTYRMIAVDSDLGEQQLLRTVTLPGGGRSR